MTNKTNEIIETAKATQEVAKTTAKALGTVEKFGGFLVKVFGEPLDIASGMLGDKLKFMRWERQVRFMDRVNEINERRAISGNEKAIPPKIAIPILENASLEEEDDLQDLWVNLLSSAQDKSQDEKHYLMYVEILKQLSIEEARFLNIFLDFVDYDMAKSEDESKTRQDISYPLDQWMSSAGVRDRKDQEFLSDNLKRLRLIEDVTGKYGVKEVKLTVLGERFIEACVLS